MKIIVCEGAGFCYGIRRATDLLEKLLESGKKVCCLGELLHNPGYMEDLRRRGVRVIHEVGELPPDACLLIRSHGVGPDVYRQLAERGAEYYDATCPSVARIHRLAAEADADTGVFLLAGDREHPEVQGITGHCTSQYFTFRSALELGEILENNPEIGKKTPTVAEVSLFVIPLITLRVYRFTEPIIKRTQ